MFKIIGVVLGYLVFNLPGAFLGYFIGSSIDRSRSYGIGGVNPFTHGHRQTVFIKTIFTLMGKLAKADGHISQDEIDHVELFIEKNGMSAEHRKEAITLFKQGAANDYDIQPLINEFMSVCGHTRNLPQILIVYLIVMSIADGHLHTDEENLLRQIAARLGFGSIEFQQLLDMTLNQFNFSGGQSG